MGLVWRAAVGRGVGKARQGKGGGEVTDSTGVSPRQMTSQGQQIIISDLIQYLHLLTYKSQREGVQDFVEILTPGLSSALPFRSN